ncbi:polyribonucleotide nucleotidyltransferase, partial [Hyphomonas adhaerens]|uniref:polyribonucleotide nucleotidyltransferase n=1 Tax=Hyphomonas adhaerens TaxID=81029 RepID=UPI0023530FA6
VVLTAVSYDLENDPDILGMIGASAALVLSGAPFMGPIGAARVGYKDGEYIINPSQMDLEESELDLVVAGTADAVMMVESQAKELSEDIMLGAVVAGHDAMQPVIDAIIDLAEKAAKAPFDFEPVDNSAAVAAIQGIVGGDLSAAYKITEKLARQAAVAEARDKAKAALVGTEEAPGEMSAETFKAAFKETEAAVVRGDILKTGERIDGRKLDQVRPIVAEAGFLPRTHGSSLFTRGETQAICVATLGTSDDEQYIDSLDGTRKENFLLHYNFPPYSVGETGRMGGAGRREIGHGKLAWRALKAVLPDHAEFPYTIRLVSEITESNGSSSMATVCGCSLAMMDAGVPVKRPVSGIAMGLILEGEEFAVLSDILGDEDHLGDMDFKVAGTEVGVTSLQMDIKVAGITKDIMEKALAQANGGRMHILGKMAEALGESRGALSENAPQMEIIKVPTDKIRDVIGSGGKVIRGIVDESGAKVNIDDDGTVQVSALDRPSIDKALQMIKEIVAEPEVGEIYQGTVVGLKDFGAFVNFFGPKDGLVHVSQMANERVGHPKDVVKEGDKVWVKLLGFDDRGKVRLSMKVVDQETGKEISEDKDGEEE